MKHQIKYEKYIKEHGVGSNDRVADSVASYISYLKSVERYLNIEISPNTLKCENDLDLITSKLSGKVSENTIRNYVSAMRHYISMVEQRGL